MKLLLAPSETMANAPQDTHTTPLFPNKTQALLNILAKKSVEDLADLFDVSTKIAEVNYARFQDFQETHNAMHAYTGYMFKMMDKPSLSDESISYIERHLLIVSGLYGLVRMTDKIGHYRLPMGVSLDQPLSDYWADSISAHLRDEFIIDLLSQEYRDALHMNDLDTVTIDFVEIKDGKEKRPAMMLKKCRGLMVRACSEAFVKTRDDLKEISVDGFTFNPDRSRDEWFVYDKHTS